MAFLAQKKIVTKEDVASNVFVSVKSGVSVKVSSIENGVKEPYHMTFDGGIYRPRNELEYKILLTRSRVQKDIAPILIERLKEVVSSLKKEPEKKKPRFVSQPTGLDVFEAPK